jgi:hypothetical protein
MSSKPEAFSYRCGGCLCESTFSREMVEKFEREFPEIKPVGWRGRENIAPVICPVCGMPSFVNLDNGTSQLLDPEFDFDDLSEEDVASFGMTLTINIAQQHASGAGDFMIRQFTTPERN